jgi:cytochrome P450
MAQEVIDLDLDTVFATLVAEEGRADPYPTYEMLHEVAPMFTVLDDTVAVVLRYDDCNTVLRDRRFGRGQSVYRPVIAPDDLIGLDLFWEGRASLLMNDPPEHTRLRSLVSKAFTPRTVEHLRPEMARVADRLLDAVPRGEVVDWMRAVALPLPLTAIGELFGVPEEDRAQFEPLMRDATPAFEPLATLEEVRTAHAASVAMTGYFKDLVKERRVRPTDDLLSALVQAEQDGERLEHEELIAIAALMFVAGFDTAANLIGNGMFALLRHPGELDRLRQDPELIPRGVEELLRWDTPAQLNSRKVLEPAELGGQVLEPDSYVLLLLGAANRDPLRFHHPNVLDVMRNEGPPLSFGGGVHYCLGAALARLEAQVVFDRLLARYPRIELCDDPKRHDTLTMRGLAELPVRLWAD